MFTKAAAEFLYHRHTPTIYSDPLSRLINKPVYLKLDCLQPSGSFKDRGIGKLISHYVHNENVNVILGASGGNAGLAVATVSNKLHKPCHIIVPESTNKLAISKIQSQNAKVTIHGKSFQEADAYAHELIQEMNSDKDPNHKAAYVHPYDNELIWEGHSSLIDELILDFQEMRYNESHSDHEYYALSDDNNHCPSCIIASVGGGGLANGICVGMKRHGWNEHVTLITAETIGCDSFYQSFMKGELITLDAITSIANTLGAKKVNSDMLHFTMNSDYVKSCVPVRVSDSEAVSAVKSFLNDHRLLVEPACSASLAVLYNEKYVNEVLAPFDNVVVEVCGGSGINLDILNGLLEKFDL